MTTMMPVAEAALRLGVPPEVVHELCQRRGVFPRSGRFVAREVEELALTLEAEASRPLDDADWVEPGRFALGSRGRATLAQMQRMGARVRAGAFGPEAVCAWDVARLAGLPAGNARGGLYNRWMRAAAAAGARAAAGAPEERVELVEAGQIIGRPLQPMKPRAALELARVRGLADDKLTLPRTAVEDLANDLRAEEAKPDAPGDWMGLDDLLPGWTAPARAVQVQAWREAGVRIQSRPRGLGDATATAVNVFDVARLTSFALPSKVRFDAEKRAKAARRVAAARALGSLEAALA